MLVQCTSLSAEESRAFESAIRDSGRDPAGFKAQMFQAAANDCAQALRRVHVMSRHAAAQYDASGDTQAWTRTFAGHLARGFFG